MNKTYIAMGFLATLGLMLAGNKAKANATLANKLLKDHKGVKEYDPKFKSMLVEFWKGAGLSESKATSWGYRYAWSAAFISYVMRESGYKNFPVSTTHTCFASKIKAKRYKEFELRRVSSYAPKVGDIVLLNRGGGNLTYDEFKCGDASHSDIVVSVNKQAGIMETIGGNLSNQILKRSVKIDSNGKIDNSKYFAIIEVK